MEKYTCEEGIMLLNRAGFSLSQQETVLFREEFNNLYPANFNFIYSVWKVYSEILPFKIHSDELESIRYLIKIKRDDEFQKKVIDSGLSKNLSNIFS